jgi:hypothetical protein
MALTRSTDYFISNVSINALNGTTEWVDVFNIMIEMHLFEDIHKPFLHGTLMLSDTSGLISKLPINGEEFLKIELETPGAEIVVEHEFKIHKVTNRQSIGNTQETYVLHFMSKEAFKNATTPISLGFNGELISDMVQKVYDDNLKLDKDIDIEPTLNPRRMSFASWSPSRIILEMMKTAQSATHKEGADYKFWESLDGFHFRSVQSLYRDIEPIADSDDREILHWSAANLCDPAIAWNNQSIRAYNVVSQGNQTQRLVNGGLANSQISFDPVAGSVAFADKTIEEVASAVETLEANNPVSSQAAAQFYGQANAHANQMLVFTDAAEEFASGIETWAQTARIQRELQFNTKIDVEVAGNTGRTIGQVVDLRLPAQTGIETAGEPDPQLSGNALIVAINHIWRPSEYIQSMRLIKDSAQEDIDSLAAP